jgi:hypothetical protein
MARPSKEKEIEFEPDAWERFERAVKIVAKAPPQHRVKTTNKAAKRIRGTKKTKRDS